VWDGKRLLLSGHDVTAGSSASGGLEAPRRRTCWGFYLQPLPRPLGVLDAVGRGAHLRLAAEQRPFAAPNHNPAAVVGAQIEQLERTTRSRGLGGSLVSQPPELVLDGVGCRAEFGGDPAEPEALRSQTEQPLDRDGGPGKPGHQSASNATRLRSHERTGFI
jgi:hypothetical protein